MTATKSDLVEGATLTEEEKRRIAMRAHFPLHIDDVCWEAIALGARDKAVKALILHLLHLSRDFSGVPQEWHDGVEFAASTIEVAFRDGGASVLEDGEWKEALLAAGIERPGGL